MKTVNIRRSSTWEQAYSRLGQLSMEDLCNMSNRRFVDFYYLYSEFFCGRVAVCKHMHACKIKTKTKLKHRSHCTMK